LKPLLSKRWMILPIKPRWTPSGLIIRKVRSWTVKNNAGINLQSF
jgi:hypothetical protein